MAYEGCKHTTTHTHLLSKCHNIIIMQYWFQQEWSIWIPIRMDVTALWLLDCSCFGLGSKHSIVSPFTIADGHKMLESPSKTSTDYCVCSSYCAILLPLEICALSSMDEFSLNGFWSTVCLEAWITYSAVKCICPFPEFWSTHLCWIV